MAKNECQKRRRGDRFFVDDYCSLYDSYSSVTLHWSKFVE